MTETDKFPEWPKTPRLRSEIIITEKIDGTNGLIQIGEDGTLRVGSRSRWITPEDDNYGFARWAHNHPPLLALPPGRYYGEWWGQGIQRKYNIQEKRFSFFYLPCKPPEGTYMVPHLYTGPWDMKVIEDIMTDLAISGSKAAPGFLKPEGIVVYHKQSRQRYKYTLDGDKK